MGAAVFGGSFAPIVQCEKWEIHKVFPHFPHFPLGQNLLPKILAPLCGIALSKKGAVSCDFEITWGQSLSFINQASRRLGMGSRLWCRYPGPGSTWYPCGFRCNSPRSLPPGLPFCHRINQSFPYKTIRECLLNYKRMTRTRRNFL